MSIFQDSTSLMQKARQQLHEKVVNPYAVGMAAAMKATGDKPPLEKSTIMKAHKIAKKVEKAGYEPEGEQIDELAPLVAGGLALGGALAGAAAIRRAQQGAKAGVEAAKKGEKIAPGTSVGHAAYGLQKKSDALNAAMKQLRNSYEPEIVDHLIENGFAETEQNALKIMENMSESWVEEILNELSLGQIGGAVEKAADTYVKPNLERIGAQKGRERVGNLPIIGDVAAQAGKRTAGSLYDQGKNAIKKGDLNTAIKTGRTALDMLRNSYEHGVYGDDLSELNRLEREQGKESGGNPDKAYQHVAKMMRNMQGKPAGQRKKVPGKKPPAAGEYGAPRSPAQKVALRRAAEKRSQDMQSSKYD